MTEPREDQRCCKSCLSRTKEELEGKKWTLEYDDPADFVKLQVSNCENRQK